MEENILARDLMDENEFKEYIERTRPIYNRAYRRGQGLVNHPFNNRANTCKRKNRHSRANNELKKTIYGQIRRGKV